MGTAGRLLVVVAIATPWAWLATACGRNGSDASRMVATTATAYSARVPATLAKAHDISFDPCTLVSRAEAEAIVNTTVSADPVRASRDNCLVGGDRPLTALVGLHWRVVIDPAARARIKALANDPSARGVPVPGVGQEAVWTLNTLGAAAGGYRIEAGVTVNNVGDQAKSERLALTVISHLPAR